MHSFAPGLFERTMARQVDRKHFQRLPASPDAGNVLAPVGEGAHVHGGWRPPGLSWSKMALYGGLAALPLLLVWRNRRPAAPRPLGLPF